MSERKPIEAPHYVVVTIVWYLTMILVGGAVTIFSLHVAPPSVNGFHFGIVFAGLMLIVLGVVAPAAVALALWRFRDPAIGMTVSHLILIGHVLLISGPLVLVTPVAARYLAIKRHESGGY